MSRVKSSDGSRRDRDGDLWWRRERPVPPPPPLRVILLRTALLAVALLVLAGLTTLFLGMAAAESYIPPTGSPT